MEFNPYLITFFLILFNSSCNSDNSSLNKIDFSITQINTNYFGQPMVFPNPENYSSLISTEFKGPIININVDPSYFFGEFGIYVAGNDSFLNPNYNAQSHVEPLYLANFAKEGSDWERPAHVSYSINDSILWESDMIIETHGKGSLYNGFGHSLFLDCPSNKFDSIYSEIYGNNWLIPKTLHFPIFNEAGVNSYNGFIVNHLPDVSLIREEISNRILNISKLNCEFPEGQFAILFLNQIYWGIVRIEEKLDKHYFKIKYETDSFDLIEPVYNWALNYRYQVHKETSKSSRFEFDSLVNLISSNDGWIIQNNNYSSIEQLIDFNSYIDMALAHIYFGNKDWPGNNLKVWRSSATKWKWTFIINDLDLILQNDNVNSITNCFIMASNIPDAKIMLPYLLQHPEFRSKFLKRADELFLAWSSEAENICLNSINELSPLVGQYSLRYPNFNTNDWNIETTNVKEILNNRYSILEQDLQNIRLIGKH